MSHTRHHKHLRANVGDWLAVEQSDGTIRLGRVNTTVGKGGRSSSRVIVQTQENPLRSGGSTTSRKRHDPYFRRPTDEAQTEAYQAVKLGQNAWPVNTHRISAHSPLRVGGWLAKSFRDWFRLPWATTTSRRHTGQKHHGPHYGGNNGEAKGVILKPSPELTPDQLFTLTEFPTVYPDTVDKPGTPEVSIAVWKPKWMWLQSDADKKAGKPAPWFEQYFRFYLENTSETERQVVERLLNDPVFLSEANALLRKSPEAKTEQQLAADPRFQFWDTIANIQSAEECKAHRDDTRWNTTNNTCETPASFEALLRGLATSIDHPTGDTSSNPPLPEPVRVFAIWAQTAPVKPGEVVINPGFMDVYLLRSDALAQMQKRTCCLWEIGLSPESDVQVLLKPELVPRRFLLPPRSALIVASVTQNESRNGWNGTVIQARYQSPSFYRAQRLRQLITQDLGLYYIPGTDRRTFTEWTLFWFTDVSTVAGKLTTCIGDRITLRDYIDEGVPREVRAEQKTNWKAVSSANTLRDVQYSVEWTKQLDQLDVTLTTDRFGLWIASTAKPPIAVMPLNIDFTNPRTPKDVAADAEDAKKATALESELHGLVQRIDRFRDEKTFDQWDAFLFRPAIVGQVQSHLNTSDTRHRMVLRRVAGQLPMMSYDAFLSLVEDSWLRTMNGPLTSRWWIFKNANVEQLITRDLLRARGITSSWTKSWLQASDALSYPVDHIASRREWQLFQLLGCVLPAPVVAPASQLLSVRPEILSVRPEIPSARPVALPPPPASVLSPILPSESKLYPFPDVQVGDQIISISDDDKTSRRLATPVRAVDRTKQEVDISADPAGGVDVRVWDPRQGKWLRRDAREFPPSTLRFYRPHIAVLLEGGAIGDESVDQDGSGCSAQLKLTLPETEQPPEERITWKQYADEFAKLTSLSLFHPPRFRWVMAFDKGSTGKPANWFRLVFEPEQEFRVPAEMSRRISNWDRFWLGESLDSYLTENDQKQLLTFAQYLKYNQTRQPEWIRRLPTLWVPNKTKTKPNGGDTWLIRSPKNPEYSYYGERQCYNTADDFFSGDDWPSHPDPSMPTIVTVVEDFTEAVATGKKPFPMVGQCYKLPDLLKALDQSQLLGWIRGIGVNPLVRFGRLPATNNLVDESGIQVVNRQGALDGGRLTDPPLRAAHPVPRFLWIPTQLRPVGSVDPYLIGSFHGALKQIGTLFVYFRRHQLAPWWPVFLSWLWKWRADEWLTTRESCAEYWDMTGPASSMTRADLGPYIVRYIESRLFHVNNSEDLSTSTDRLYNLRNDLPPPWSVEEQAAIQEERKKLRDGGDNGLSVTDYAIAVAQHMLGLTQLASRFQLRLLFDIIFLLRFIETEFVRGTLPLSAEWVTIVQRYNQARAQQQPAVLDSERLLARTPPSVPSVPSVVRIVDGGNGQKEAATPPTIPSTLVCAQATTLLPESPPSTWVQFVGLESDDRSGLRPLHVACIALEKVSEQMRTSTEPEIMFWSHAQNFGNRLQHIARLGLESKDANVQIYIDDASTRLLADSTALQRLYPTNTKVLTLLVLQVDRIYVTSLSSGELTYEEMPVYSVFPYTLAQRASPWWDAAMQWLWTYRGWTMLRASSRQLWNLTAPTSEQLRDRVQGSAFLLRYESTLTNLTIRAMLEWNSSPRLLILGIIEQLIALRTQPAPWTKTVSTPVASADVKRVTDEEASLETYLNDQGHSFLMRWWSIPITIDRYRTQRARGLDWLFQTVENQPKVLRQVNVAWVPALRNDTTQDEQLLLWSTSAPFASSVFQSAPSSTPTPPPPPLPSSAPPPSSFPTRPPIPPPLPPPRPSVTLATTTATTPVLRTAPTQPPPLPPRQAPLLSTPTSSARPPPLARTTPSESRSSSTASGGQGHRHQSSTTKPSNPFDSFFSLFH